MTTDNTRPKHIRDTGALKASNVPREFAVPGPFPSHRAGTATDAPLRPFIRKPFWTTVRYRLRALLERRTA